MLFCQFFQCENLRRVFGQKLFWKLKHPDAGVDMSHNQSDEMQLASKQIDADASLDEFITLKDIV